MLNLKEKYNCYKIASTSHFTCLINGEQYFLDLYQELLQARHHICILGWDIDFRVSLTRQYYSADLGIDLNNPRSRLGDVLKTVCQERPQLRAYILIWGAPLIYLKDRELFADFKAKWTFPSNMYFIRDDEHPLLSSHHQKIVIIDDVVYCGGIDITSGRWDTFYSLAQDPRRFDLSNGSYGPFHDAMVKLQGPILEHLLQIFIDRWNKAGTSFHLRLNFFHFNIGANVNTNANTNVNLNSSLESHKSHESHQMKVAIARTAPSYKGSKKIREIEKLYLDLIQAAQHYIYIENQYFASRTIARELGAVLRKKNGPQVTLLLPSQQCKLLEEKTMGILLRKYLRYLRKNDIYQRLGVFSPTFSPDALSQDSLNSKDSPTRIIVHAKIMVVDDCWLRVGSSNLNERSLGMDTECDVLIDGNGNGIEDIIEKNDLWVQEIIRNTKCQFLSSLTHLAPEEVQSALLAFDPHHEGKRGINSFLGRYPACQQRFKEQKGSKLNEIDSWIISNIPIDTKEPLAAEEVMEHAFLHYRPLLQKITAHPRKTLFIIVGVTALIGGISWLAHKFHYSHHLIHSPWHEIVHKSYQYLLHISQLPYAGGICILFYTVAGPLFFPLNLFIICMAGLFTPLQAFTISFAGMLGATAVSYLLGRGMSESWWQKHFPRTYIRMANILKKTNWRHIALLRLLPVAPFNIVNMVCGAAKMPLRDYFLGTSLGVIPGMLTLILLQQSLLNFLQTQNLGHALIFILVCLLAAMLYRFLRKRIAVVGT